MIIALGKLPITLDILTKTRVGFTVNNLRKSIKDDEQTSALAKDLIKKWKKLMESNAAAKNAANSQDSNGSSNGGREEKSSISISGNNSNDSVSHHNSHSNRDAPSSKPAKTSSYSSGDASTNEIRGKCREMIAGALKKPLPDALLNSDEIDLGELGDAEDLAEQIEDHIYKEFRNTDQKYKNRVRSRVANLKDDRNPDLRLNVLRGIISTERIAKMDSTEMASNEMKQLREKITKEMIQEHQISLSGGTQTDLIKCPKCKKSNVTYNQVQTRSADEPMTTFCLCNECGKRWKFC